MNTYVRALLLALFCAVFGFVGALGGVAVARGSLVGEQGATGSAGPRGPAGPPGPQGPAAASDDLEALARSIVELRGEVADLKLRALQATNAGSDCSAGTTQVVTDVRLTELGFGPRLDVQKTPWLICLTRP